MSVVRYGMVGGGPGAFIGAVHRMAAALDGGIRLVAGAFSRDAQTSLDFGRELGLGERAYPDFQAMMHAEAALPAAERMQFVAIVTPNDAHFEIATAALAEGFPVLSDKPVTVTTAQAEALARQSAAQELQFGVTHTYTGYPLVREARERIARGDLGDIARVVVEYHQGWLAPRVADETARQAAWRLDPARAGASCCMGDIGVHAFNLAEFVTGQPVTALLPDVGSVAPGRQLDDDGTVLVRFTGGARGVLMASQIALGEENDLRIRVYGSEGALAWRQQEPNSMTLRFGDRPMEVLRTGEGYLGAAAQAATRLPPGHPEGYIEAFANLYRDFASAITDNRPLTGIPDINAGVRGMRFIELSVQSENQGQWQDMPS